MKLIFCICGVGLAIFFGFGVFLAARQSPVWVRFSCLFCSQPLAVPMSSFQMTSTLKFVAKLSTASGD
jgi:hypothetical protein